MPVPTHAPSFFFWLGSMLYGEVAYGVAGSIPIQIAGAQKFLLGAKTP